jgi:sugar O-acyltransferase (sialic acid O-acetyltransferase NeuD family)
MARASLGGLVIVGASTYGRILAEIVRLARTYDLVGFIDDDPALTGTDIEGVPVLGSLAALTACARTDVAAAIGIGGNAGRRAAAERAIAAGLDLATLVHPAAWVSPSARLGPGTVVDALATVGANARVGRGVAIWPAATVGHDSVVQDFCFLSPGARIGGFAQLEDEVKVSMNAVVRAHARVPAGLVVKELEAFG